MVPKFNVEIKRKNQIVKNKCIQFCFQLDKMSTISNKEFEDSSWLPLNTRSAQVLLILCLNLAMAIVLTM